MMDMRKGDIQNIVIEGGGTMGASMARIFAQQGYSVTLHGRRQETLDRARGQLDEGTQRAIRFSLTDEAFADCDLLVENIAEELEVKRAYFARVSRLVREDTILATNTSGLSISKIAEAVEGPERFAGFHWFNPPHIIPLIEVIAGDRTAPETADRLYRLAEAIGKKPIHVNRDVPGFIANRIQLAILRECVHMVEQGIGSYEDIDRAMKYGLGFRYACLGPFEVVDHGGADIFCHIAEYLYRDLSAAQSPEGLLADMVGEGRFGVKSGRGFYDYGEERAAEAIAARNRMYEKLAEANITEV